MSIQLPDGKEAWRRRQAHMWMAVCIVAGLANVYVYAAVLHWLPSLLTGMFLLAIPAAYYGLPAAWALLQRLLLLLPAEGDGRVDSVLIGVTDDDRRRPLCWLDRQREAPTLVLGGTRRGKSTFQAYITSQDIRRGKTVIVVDPHRDLALNLLPACLETHREVVWFEPGDPERIPGYNPLEVRDGWSPMARAKMVVDAVVRIWFPFTAEIPMRIIDSLTHVLHLLSANGYTLLEVPRVLLQDGFRNFLAEKVFDTGLREWLAWFNGLTPQQRYEQVTSTLIRLNQLIHHPDAALVLGQERSTFSLADAIAGRQVFLAALTSARLQSAAHLLGGFLTTELIYLLMRRLTASFESRQAVYVVFDEFDQIVPEAIKDFVSQAGKTGCRLTLIGQSPRMIDPRIRDAVLANCTNRILFGLIGPEAMELAQQVFEPDPRLVKEVIADVRPVYYTPQEQWAFWAARLQELPPHTYFVVTQNSSGARRLRLPRFEPHPAEELEMLRRDVLERATRPRAEVVEEIQRRRRELDRRFGPLDEGLPLPPGEEPPGPRVHAPF